MSIETERSLLATMMLRPGDCWGVTVERRHFVSEQHAELFSCVERLSGESLPVDPVSVCDALTAQRRPELGHLALKLSADALLTTQPKVYADRIRADWRLREAHIVAATLQGAVDEVAIDAAVGSLIALHVQEGRFEYSAADAMAAGMADMQESHDGSKSIPSGMRDLDRKLGGFHGGDLIVVGARPGMGKTSMAMGMARSAALAGVPVGIISGEQPVEQVASRLLSLASGVPAVRFRGKLDPAEMSRASDAAVITGSLPLWIYDRSSPSLVEVVRVSRRWAHLHGIKALYVDYLQRLEADGARRFEAVGANVKGMKDLARDLGIPVVLLAQVSRQVEQRSPPEPRMGDLSDSSEIEKEADQILMLYREEQYNSKTEKRGIAKIIIEKNRHGPTGWLEVAFDAPTMRFADLAKVDPIWGGVE